MLSRQTTEAVQSGGVDRARTLKELVRALPGMGVSYAEICSLVDASFGWNSNALKQFVARESATRLTEKVVALSRVAVRLFDEHKFQLLESERSRLEVLKDSVLDSVEGSVNSIKEASPVYSTNIFAREVGNRFKVFRERSFSSVYVPEKFAFVRYGRDPKQIIVVLIASMKTTEGYCFSMKIEGNNERRRIVVGDVSSTTSNTYFSGIAYHVTKRMSYDDFVGLDSFDLRNLKELVSQNEVGIEFMALSSSNLFEPVAPVAFTGLDGAGRPISGVGLFIVEEEFDTYSIDDTVVSHLQCSKANKPLQVAMTILGARTVLPSDLSDESVRRNLQLSGSTAI